MTRTVWRNGDHGGAVRDLQERLRALGYPTGADGVFDDVTEVAVRDFQAARGLRVDGICGPETWGALVESGYRLGDRLLQLRGSMMRGDDVADLQRRLNALGFDSGREDGILGPATDAAIRRFQRDAGLATDGVCGPATIDALVRLGTLAAGSVATVREREALRRDRRRLDERRLFVVADPGLQALAVAVARGLREAGAEVALDASGSDPSLLAGEANRFEADLCLVLGSTTDPGCRCAYFATERFRSEAGFTIAASLSDALRSVLGHVDEPVGRRYRILRETRMAAVVVEVDAADAPFLAPRTPTVTRAIVEGVRRGVEHRLDATS